VAVPTLRGKLLQELLRHRILLLDGATGTELAKKGLDASDYGGPEKVGCHEALLLYRPDVVLDLHRSYLAAGADIVETNSFGATRVVLSEYGLADRAQELNRIAASLARQACAEFEVRDGRPRFVAGSMGPTTKSLTLTGGVDFDKLVAAYAEQAQGLAEGGADLLLIETCQDGLNLKAALVACQEAAPQLPVAVSATLEPTGMTLGGQTIEAVLVMVEPWQPLWVGINCSTGPRAMTEHVRALAALSPFPVAVVPNAGIPDSQGRYGETPEEMAAVLSRFAQEGWLNLVGGCCGTTPEHIAALRKAMEPFPSRTPPAYDCARVCGADAVELVQKPAPLLIGERTNVLGSRRFRELVRAGRFAEAAEIGRRQVRGGAHLLDVCLADPERDEREDMVQAVKALRRAVRAPLMVDSTDPAVFEAALQLIPGRPILNSVNLEDGGVRLEQVARLARKYGAVVVAGCIDDHPTDGMARTAQRKLEVAEKLLQRLQHMGLRRREILLDPLVFPAASGDPKFAGAAAETIRGLRLLKQAFPDCLTVLGISNVSFGLPKAAREVLNAVFLHACVEAGLDAAIVNTEQLVRFASLDGGEVRLAEAVLFEGSQAAVESFVARYRNRPERGREDELAKLPADQRLRQMVVEGQRTGLEATLDELLRSMEPLEIINGPLMAGMDEVGRLFGAGKLIVAEVLLSAEVMQKAVDYLRPHLKGQDSENRGAILLATVRGDVHDIGKNLVGIIFATNGFRVVDLGVQCPSEKLIAAWREHRTELIGLSGLLVRSAHQMAATAADLTAAGITPPLLVGGAALSGAFVREHIAPVYGGEVRYAAHAMEGLALAQEILARKRPPATPARPQETPQEALKPSAGESEEATAAKATEEPEQSGNEPPVVLPAGRKPQKPREIPAPPDLARHILRHLPLDEIFAYLNHQMLLGKHLGLKGSVARLLEASDVKAKQLVRRVQALQDAAVTRGWLAPKAVYRFVRASSRGNEIILWDADGQLLAVLPFRRQSRPPHLCAADWVSPNLEDQDNVALFVVTAGEGVRQQAEAMRREGRFLDSIALEALALETAEATAEWLHQRLRALWGFPDPPELTMAERFRARYRGIRLSFGYPACPDLAPQAELFRLLQPEEIGVRLTEEYMMEPEASVSAVVFHHPEARYYA